MIAQYNTEAIETVYTYNEWKKEYKRREAEEKEERTYFIKQKLFGIMAIIFAIAEFALAQMEIITEGGAFILLVPLGLYALFTKEKICTF